MLTYLQKFNRLPQELRDKISSPQMMDVIHDIENKYGVDLATIIMKTMVREMDINDLEKFFSFEYNLSRSEASMLVKELDQNIFSKVSNYLAYVQKKPEGDSSVIADSIASKTKRADFYFDPEDEEEVRKLSKKNNFTIHDSLSTKIETLLEQISTEVIISFSSNDLSERFKQVMRTYLRGIRKKIDTKQTLMKSVEIGGLGLSQELTDKIMFRVDKINKAEASAYNVEHPPRKTNLPEDVILVKPQKINKEEIKPVEAIKPESKPVSSPKDSKESAEIIPPGPKVTLRDVSYDFTKFKDKEKIEEDNKKTINTPKPLETEPSLKQEKMSDPEQAKKKSFAPPDKSAESKLTTESAKKKIVPTKSAIEEKEKNLSKEDKELNIPEKMILDLSATNKKHKAVPKTGQRENIDQSNGKNIQTNAVSMAEFRKKAEQANKVKVEDIKYVPKLSGIVEELGDMNVVEFRRLGSTTKEAIDKIVKMIKSLEKTSYAKRSAGVKAWRGSPIYQQYLQIGQESILTKKDIKEIIMARQQQDSNTLTEDEVEAVIKINKLINY